MPKWLDDPAVLERVGRNLLTYQQIEHLLKRVIPFIHPKGGKLGADAARRMTLQIKEATLGSTMERFADAVEVDSPSFAAELKALVLARNELVHGLILIREGFLAMSDGHGTIASYLDEQFESSVLFKDLILPMYDLIQDALEQMQISSLNEAGPASA